MKHAKFVEHAKRDPARLYARPADVLRDRRLTDLERVEILAAWERDARALTVATEEAMGGGEPPRLHQVAEARLEAERRSASAREGGASASPDGGED